MTKTMIARALLWVLALMPLLAAAIALPEGSFRNGAAALSSLGRLTAIGGLGMFLVAAIVSFRIPGFDRVFGGLTTLWQTHHLLGAWAFLLLLAHPLLLALAATDISLAAGVAVLLPKSGGTATWLGWGALLAMMAFLAPSFAFFGRPHYQRWKWLHRLSGVAAVLALAHTFMLARTLPEPWDTLMWVTLAAAALAALGYGLVLSRRANRYRYQVAEVARPANNVVELSLVPEGRALSYQAGQFVYLSPLDPGLAAGCGEEHPYTLSSAPGEPVLRIAIKDLGDASRAIQTIATGTEVRITGPYGAFFPDRDDAPELWIAGGIGITPFLARTRALAQRGRAVNIQLIYCVQDQARTLFGEELTRLAATIPGFVITLHYFYRDGPLDGDFVRYHCPDVSSRQVYVCGPTPLLDLARQVVLGAGLPRARFHSEEFNLL